jgi:hypothetical protein
MDELIAQGHGDEDVGVIGVESVGELASTQV